MDKTDVFNNESSRVYLATISVSGRLKNDWIIVIADNISEATGKVDDLLQNELIAGSGLPYARRDIARIELFPVWKIID